MEEGELAGQAFEVQVTAKVMFAFDHFEHFSVAWTNLSCKSQLWGIDVSVKSDCGNDISVRQ